MDPWGNLTWSNVDTSMKNTELRGKTPATTWIYSAGKKRPHKGTGPYGATVI